MASCGADIEANSLITSLTQDAKFDIPDVDLSGPAFQFPDGALTQPVEKLEVSDVTTGSVDGPGAFDTLMRGFRAHLMEEFDKGRITGDDYTKAYIALTESAMNQAVTFLLGKDAAYWQAQNAQIQAFIARVQLEETKVRLAATQFEAATQKANYALTKMRMATESSAYCTSEYNLTNILPQQKEMLIAQVAREQSDSQAAAFNVTTMLPLQRDYLASQKQGQDTANDSAVYNLSNLLPAQLSQIQQQVSMIIEQTEAQRAQTADVRGDGAAVLGVLGKQKELYSQQITSYKRDSELKVAKIFSDSWTVQKTIDEGLTAPNSFTNPEIEKVMLDLRAKAQLGV